MCVMYVYIYIYMCMLEGVSNDWLRRPCYLLCDVCPPGPTKALAVAQSVWGRRRVGSMPQRCMSLPEHEALSSTLPTTMMSQNSNQTVHNQSINQ